VRDAAGRPSRARCTSRAVPGSGATAIAALSITTVPVHPAGLRRDRAETATATAAANSTGVPAIVSHSARARAVKVVMAIAQIFPKLRHRLATGAENPADRAASRGTVRARGASHQRSGRSTR
jgi:hypothetical protein